MTERLLRTRAVLKKLGCSEATFYRHKRSGRFIAPVILGTRAVAWREADVDSWITEQSRQAQERAGEVKAA